ncbi:ABC transporter ATP-binding protein, YtfR [Thermobacillus xylanilyticus]|uniref:ABC transporter ATP-binding protein, YtfR n=1 Tax=Thermobacillus xylanilyticus TaxID=76633 RepID=A0ABM8UZ62_THEXY|nr:sugar ABC transporter ATP-binding protein [Thermobacillus xylanilyticus]CAG5076207.1 ABC transporter ATP-binding protein, YtfR [Thermobacillus xylanilyticus]
MSENRPILQMFGIHKRFPGVHALNDVRFRMFAGEVHALMGENGAGKSTLIKVLTGVYPVDEGSVEWEGRPLHLRSPLEAQQAGISTVYQEINLCPNLSVAENIFIGREPRKFGKISWKAMNRAAEALLAERLNVKLDVTKPLDTYSVAVQQLVAIARALNISARLLILDEPTSSLDRDETNKLFEVMRHLKKQGLAILFVTHFLDQVYEVSDRITILRNGRFVGEYLTDELPRVELVQKMIGKDLELLGGMPKRTAAPGEAKPPYLRASGLGRKGGVEPFDLTIGSGEIVGLAGLLGSGRTETARLLFGADRADQGRLVIEGREIRLDSPRKAIDRGIAFCSENRKSEGIIEDLTVRENIILALQAHRGWFRALSRRRQEEIADEYIRALDIKPPDPEQFIRNLSGGNQQKVMLARWLLMNPRLLILDEPTRGIDVGAKAEIQKLVLSLSREGMAVLFISSELEEVVRVSSRIAVLRDRRHVRHLTGDDIQQTTIMQAIAGG